MKKPTDPQPTTRRATTVPRRRSRLRRALAPLCLVIGAFLLTAGVLGRLWVYEKVAVMPADASIDVVAQTAPDAPATYFDISKLEEVRGPLENKTKIRGDTVAANEAGDQLGKDVVVWHAYTCSGPLGENCLDDSFPLAGEETVLALTAHGSKVVPWKGADDLRDFQKPEGAVNATGFVYKLPFDVKKRDYTWWNGSLGKDVKLSYEGEGTVKGLKVYRFSQTVPATKVGTLDLPGSVIGSKAATVTADRIAATKLEMTVEPETGVQITTTSSPTSYLAVDGKRVLTLTQATLSINDATIADTVKTYKPLAFQLHLLRVWVLPVGLVLGGLLLLVGVLGSRTRRRTGDAA